MIFYVFFVLALMNFLAFVFTLILYIREAIKIERNKKMEEYIWIMACKNFTM